MGDDGVGWWTLSLLWTAVALPIKILWLPISAVLGVVLFILAPVIYIFQFFAGIFQWVFNFITSLEPLYTFLATAAFVGVVAGALMALVSWVFTNFFSMHDPDPYRTPSLTPPGATPTTGGGLRRLKSEAAGDDDSASSSYESDWQVLAQTPATMAAAAPRAGRKRRGQGLLSQTIHEEDVDSD